MKSENKLLDMLVAYASAHQHPLNVFVHMIGIPAIMLGALIPLSWLAVEVGSLRFTAAHLLLVGFFLFYVTLDVVFATVFLLAGFLLSVVAAWLGELPLRTSGTIAALCFFGGYAAQFAGHAIEKSMPVLVRHPVQANLAAPFFTVVEIFKILGLRTELFERVKRTVEERRNTAAGPV